MVEGQEHIIELEKNKMYYKIMNIWFSQEQKGKSIVPYMKRKGYNRVAIYGIAELGERLYYELVHNEIDVVCVIDRSRFVLGEFRLIGPEDQIPDVDVVIVTAEYYFGDIYRNLKNKTKAPIITLSGLIGNAFKLNW